MNKIKDYRTKADLSQAELGNIIGVEQNTISTWETGEYSPPLKKLKKLAEYFNCTIDDLVSQSTETA